MTPGAGLLVAQVVSVLAEDPDDGLIGKPAAWRRVAAETSMFWYQRVRAVQPACRSETRWQAGERVLEFSGRSPIFKTPELPIPILLIFITNSHYKDIINLQFFKSKSLSTCQTNMATQTRQIF